MKVKLYQSIKHILVCVDSDTLLCDGGKLLPYGACLGTIDLGTGRIDVWMPAASTPRGYKYAARRVLEAVAEIRDRYDVATLPKPGQPAVEVEVKP